MEPDEFEIAALRGMTRAAKIAVMRSLIRLAYEFEGRRDPILTSRPAGEQDVRARTRTLVAGDGP